MKRLTLLLILLLAALQWPLWLGKGSWLRVWQLDKQVEEQRAANRQLVGRNAALGAEVRDLKQGTAAIEERARNELGMIRQGEVFFQLLDPSHPSGSASP